MLKVSRKETEDEKGSIATAHAQKAARGSGSPCWLCLKRDMEDGQRSEAGMTQALEHPLCEKRLHGWEKG